MSPKLTDIENRLLNILVDINALHEETKDSRMSAVTPAERQEIYNSREFYTEWAAKYAQHALDCLKSLPR